MPQSYATPNMPFLRKSTVHLDAESQLSGPYLKKYSEIEKSESTFFYYFFILYNFVIEHILAGFTQKNSQRD